MALLYLPPTIDLEAPTPLRGLPDPDRIAQDLRGSAVESKLATASAEILSGHYRLLGLDLRLGPELRWREDAVHKRESDLRYFRRVPYLDQSVGDHKIVWELNRHQHLVTLAQAHVLLGKPEFLEELVRQLQDWIRENPFQRGINWASALEVALRSFSWIWIYHLVGRSLSTSVRREMTNALYLHGCHLEQNLSIYFSPNTHLLGEAVALHALGVLFSTFPRASSWERTGAKLVSKELQHQVRTDGSHFEQSTYYHLYALDFFLFHYILSGEPEPFRPALVSMAEYLEAVMGPERRLPRIGDDDGGRVFFPIGPKENYGRATLATCALLFDRPKWLPDPRDVEEQASWWLGRAEVRESNSHVRMNSRVFTDSGTVILHGGDVWAMVKAGGFGALSGGHSHSDALSIVARFKSEDILIDPGTYSYFEQDWRTSFRGSGAHNTVRVNNRDQAVPRGPFAWSEKPGVQIESWTSTSDEDRLIASCRYTGSGVVHRRQVLFRKPHTIFILDELIGTGSAKAEQFWHPGEPVTVLSSDAFRIGSTAVLAVCPDPDLAHEENAGWRSQGYGQKEPVPILSFSKFSRLPIFLGAVLHFGEAEPKAVQLQLIQKEKEVFLRMAGIAGPEARFTV